MAQGERNRTSSMTNPKETFENLQRALQEENRLQPKDRSKEYEELTLQRFQDHGRTTEDHDLWRECHMLEEMIAILDRRYWALNPHKKRQLEFKRLSRESASAFHEIHEYQEEVDDKGRTDEEIDNSMTTRYPSIERRDLEIQAAENYLHATRAINQKQTAPNISIQEVTAKNKDLNANPKMSWKEFADELKKDFHSDTTIRKSVERCISDNHGKRPDPWPIGGCASDYQIVDPEIKSTKDHPTPAFCKYQRISQDKKPNAQ